MDFYWRVHLWFLQENPDYDNNYFDNGEDDMDDGGGGDGDEATYD